MDQNGALARPTSNGEYLKESYERKMIKMEPWRERDQTVNILKKDMKGKRLKWGPGQNETKL